MTEDYKKVVENIKKINKVDKPDFNKKIDEPKDKYPQFYKFFEQYKGKPSADIDEDERGNISEGTEALTKTSEDEVTIKKVRK